MVCPLEIVYHDLAPSETLEVHIREQALGLAEAVEALGRCRVTLDPGQGRGCPQVSLELSMVAGDDMLATRVPGHGVPCLYQVVDGLFDTARRQLSAAAAHRHHQETVRRMELLTAL